MLLLYRSEYEMINIGEDIQIKLFEISPQKNKHIVRIGIQAPKELPIWRGEIYQKILEERKLTELIKNGDWYK